MMSANTSTLSTFGESIAPSMAWSTHGKVSCCSLRDVMSETLANELQEKEIEDIAVITEESTPVDASDWLSCDNIDTSSDLLIAQMLQCQFDSEQNSQIKLAEDKFNGTNKVKVTFDNYRPSYAGSESESDEEVVECAVQKDVKPQFNRSGFCGKGKNIITKHDPVICGRANAVKIMENLPLEFDTGDSGENGISLSNVVFNQLMAHSKTENKRSLRLHEKKEHSTTDQAVDAKTRLILYKLVNAGLLDAVNGVISCGKESVVFHGTGGSKKNDEVPAECALKIFKTTLSKFHNRCQYVRGDIRFAKDEFKKFNPRKIMKIWAEKEMINLKRMARYGIPCPSVIILKKHVLVLSFIGNSQNAAPKLRDARLSAAEWQIAYDQCLQHMRTLYKDCLLVHADLSEYNILWWQNQVYIIDVAQAVDAMHPLAVQFLLRDCENISEFFKKRGVVNVHDKFKLFSAVTDLDLTGPEQDYYSQIDQFERDEKLMQLGLSKADYPFDYFFDKSCKLNSASTPESDSSSSETEEVDTEVNTADAVSQ